MSRVDCVREHDALRGVALHKTGRLDSVVTFCCPDIGLGLFDCYLVELDRPIARNELALFRLPYTPTT